MEKTGRQRSAEHDALGRRVELEAALTRYESAYERLRVAALDAQAIAGEAMTRLRTLRRISAEAELGDASTKGPLSPPPCRRPPTSPSTPTPAHRWSWPTAGSEGPFAGGEDGSSPGKRVVDYSAMKRSVAQAWQ